MNGAMSGPPARSDDEAHELLRDELVRLAPRADALGAAGTLAVAAWALTHAFEFEAAEIAWGRAAEHDPDCIEAVFQRGLALLELGRYDAAATCFQRSVEVDARLRSDPSAEPLDWIEDDPLLRLGNCHHARGDLDAAVAAYDASAARNTVGLDALREMARCELARRRPDAALAALDRLEPRVRMPSARSDIEELRAAAELMRGARGAT